MDFKSICKQFFFFWMLRYSTCRTYNMSSFCPLPCHSCTSNKVTVIRAVRLRKFQAHSFPTNFSQKYLLTPTLNILFKTSLQQQ